MCIRDSLCDVLLWFSFDSYFTFALSYIIKKALLHCKCVGPVSYTHLNMTILSKIMETLKVDANFIFQDEMRESCFAKQISCKACCPSSSVNNA